MLGFVIHICEPLIGNEAFAVTLADDLRGSNQEGAIVQMIKNMTSINAQLFLFKVPQKSKLFNIE
jgi:UTP-glucose-1-phosphate uridylyltransferase